MSAPQMDLFLGRLERDKGIRRVAENNQEFLEAARKAANAICDLKGTVTADEVRVACPLIPQHPNAWGAVFKRGFEWTGEYRQSAIVSRHGGMQRIWRRKP